MPTNTRYDDAVFRRTSEQAVARPLNKVLHRILVPPKYAIKAHIHALSCRRMIEDVKINGLHSAYIRHLLENVEIAANDDSRKPKSFPQSISAIAALITYNGT